MDCVLEATPEIEAIFEERYKYNTIAQYKMSQDVIDEKRLCQGAQLCRIEYIDGQPVVYRYVSFSIRK